MAIYCNNCYKPLNKKEKAKYPIMWQYSGDMYCEKCDEKMKCELCGKETSKGLGHSCQEMVNVAKAYD